MPQERRFSLSKPLLGAFVVALGIVRPGTAEAWSPYLVVPDPAVAEASPAFRYANMSDADAFEELDRRKILYSKLDAVHGVRAPIRLTGRLHGVYIHSALPPDERVTSIFEILDARLALALDDFAAVLERHDIDEVVHYTMYRPNVAAPDHEGHDPTDSPKAASMAPGARRRAAPAAAPIAAKAAPTTVKAAPTAVKTAPTITKAPPATGKTAPMSAKPAPSSAKPAPASKAAAGKVTLEPQTTLDTKKGGREKSGREGARAAKQKTPAGAPEKPVVIITKRAHEPQKAAPKVAKAIAIAKPVVIAKPSAPAARPTSPVASVRPAAPVHRTTWAPPGTRHPAGLAIDVGALHKRDGRWLSVASHFQGHIGDRTCGEGVTFPAQADANELHSLVCECNDLGIFTYVLTPNYNEAHADHFHMEIKQGVRWFLYH